MTINPFDLSEEELEFENALNDDNMKNVDNFDEMKKEAIQYAKNTLKRKQLTIRPYISDIEAIKSQSSQL